jgi:hypothetical protein
LISQKICGIISWSIWEAEEMPQDDEQANTPTRKWDEDELLSSRLMTDMTVNWYRKRNLPLTREIYLASEYGLSISEDKIPEEIEADLPWDFQDPNNRCEWEYTTEPTIRDLEEYGLI